MCNTDVTSTQYSIVVLKLKKYKKIVKHCNTPYDTYVMDLMLNIASGLMIECNGIKMVYVHTNKMYIVCDIIHNELPEVLSELSALASILYTNILNNDFQLKNKLTSHFVFFSSKIEYTNNINKYFKDIISKVAHKSNKKFESSELFDNFYISWKDVAPYFRYGGVVFKHNKSIVKNINIIDGVVNIYQYINNQN